MNVAEIVASLKTHFEEEKTAVERFAEQHLPVLEHLAEQASSNPLITSVLNAAHVSPEIFAGLAAVLDKLEADLVAALPPAPETAS